MFPAKQLGPGPCPIFISPCGRLTKRVLSTAAGPATALGSRQTHQSLYMESTVLSVLKRHAASCYIAAFMCRAHARLGFWPCFCTPSAVFLAGLPVMSRPSEGAAISTARGEDGPEERYGVTDYRTIKPWVFAGRVLLRPRRRARMSIGASILVSPSHCRGQQRSRV